MKTDDLISMMATHVAPVDQRLPLRRMTQALTLGSVGSLILLMLIYGPRPDLKEMLGVPLFWFKLLFPTALAAGSLLVLNRMLRPGRRVGIRWVGIATPSLAVWVVGGLMLLGIPASERLPLLMGSTWRSCPFSITLLSLPLCLAIVWAARAMAPTRLRLTGAVAGLLAGAIAAIVYCLHCPEMSVPFWGLWYFLGMLIPAAAGMLLGPRVLRW